MMKNKKFLIPGLIILAVGVMLFIFFIQPYLSQKSTIKLSPEEMSEKVIREHVKEKFLPSEYIHKTVSYDEIFAKFEKDEIENVILPPFSSKVADLYLTDWVYENVWFTSYIGYDKTSGNFIGYDIAARVKEPELKGKELVQKFFKDVPDDSFLNKWRHGISWKIKTPTQRELWSIIYKKKKNKIYLESSMTEYPELSTVYWPEKDLIKKIGIARMEIFAPSNSGYTGVEQTQEMIMGAYNEE